MKKIHITGVALLLTTTTAMAGGIDRSGQGTGFIFEEGDAAVASLGYVIPSISSDPESSAGDVGVEYFGLNFGYKKDLGNGVDLAVIFDQPFGADIEYTTGILDGTEASLVSNAVSAIVKYEASPNASIYGGLRIQSMQGTASVPLAATYELDTDTSYGAGYLVGAAYEKPEIALRVALTYNSTVEHTLESVESSLLTASVDVDSDFDIVTPQSVNLDFQTGVAIDTLLFGSVRWVDWSEFDITPTNYPGGVLVEYDDDVITYTIGMGRRFSDLFSGSLTIGYEESTGGTSPNLGPTDGYISYGIGGEYTMNENTKIRGGIRYLDIGDTTIDAGLDFADNSAIALGASVLYSF